MDGLGHHIAIFALGFFSGGVVVAAILWKIMLMGARRVVQQMVRQGYFMKDGFQYNVTLHRSGDQG
jgi:hypothetical protein